MSMVEIGCYVGDSTEIFSQNFLEVWAVDPWLNGYDDSDAASYQHDMKIIESQFDEMAVEHDNIRKLKTLSAEAVQLFQDNSLDMVYVDGIHSYEGVKEDIALWLPKIKKGGFLCGHDYQGKFPGTIKAVDEFRKPDLLFPDSSWMVKL